MPKTKISEFSATPGNNTDIDGINIAEGCAPSGINDAIRELMAQLKDFQAGTAGDSFNGPVGTTTAAAGAFTTLTTSSTVTHNGGTANGVAYLNGSKVLTTGSALTFDGTNLGSTRSVATAFSGTNPATWANGIVLTNSATPGAGVANLVQFAGTGNVNSVFGVAQGSGGYGDFVWASFSGSFSEQMRLTSTGLGIGTSSPTAKLTAVGTVKSASATQSAFYLSNAAQTNGFLLGRSLGSDDSQNFFIYDTVAAATRLYLDSSGNLGIGTSSPATKLDVRGTVNASDGTNGNVRAYVDGTAAYLQSLNQAANAYRPVLVMGSTVSFANNGVTNATLDTSGNLGLGVTPSASWQSGRRALQIGQSGVLHSFGTTPSQLIIGANNVLDGTNYLYLNTGLASMYNQTNGVHSWFTAPSGTAGNTITFTQAMTLDASGNLGVGTTSPTQRLHVYVSAGGSWGGFADSVTTSSTPNLFGSDGTGAASIYTPAANPIKFYTNATERARITSGGSLLVGTTTSGGEIARFQTSGNTSIGVIATNTGASYLNFGDTDDANVGFVGYDHASNFMNFRINGTERARITSGGAFCAGTTSVVSVAGLNGAHSLRTDTNSNWATSFAHGGTTPYGLGLLYVNAAPNGTGNEFLYCYDSAPALRMSVRSNGGIANYSANDVNLSDRREKTNFAPAKSYLDTICAIPVQTFNYIDQSEDDPGLTLGVVAQDVQAVAPELVMESNWGTKEDPKMRLSIYQTDLQYALMKCIQEQQVMINELKAKVAALEAK